MENTKKISKIKTKEQAKAFKYSTGRQEKKNTSTVITTKKTSRNRN